MENGRKVERFGHGSKWWLIKTTKNEEGGKQGVDHQNDNDNDTTNKEEGETTNNEEGETTNNKEGKTTNNEEGETTNNKEGKTTNNEEVETTNNEEGETTNKEEGEEHGVDYQDDDIEPVCASDRHGSVGLAIDTTA